MGKLFKDPGWWSRSRNGLIRDSWILLPSMAVGFRFEFQFEPESSPIYRE